MIVVFTNITMIIILQYINAPDQHVIFLKFK